MALLDHFHIFFVIMIIGILIIIFASSPPSILSLGEFLSLGGMIGSWGAAVLSATRSSVIAFRSEMAEFRREMADFRSETITLLKEIRDLLRS